MRHRIDFQDTVCFVVQKYLNNYKEINEGECRLPYCFYPMSVARLVYNWGVQDIEILKTCLLSKLFEPPLCCQYDEIAFEMGEQIARWISDLTFRGPSQPGQDRDRARSDFIKSFNDKPVETLPIKAAIRMVDVIELKIADPSTESFAAEHFKKSEMLFKTIRRREKCFVTRFGRSVWDNLWQTYDTIKDLLKRNHRPFAF